jgi:hypothetical protein
MVLHHGVERLLCVAEPSRLVERLPDMSIILDSAVYLFTIPVAGRVDNLCLRALTAGEGRAESRPVEECPGPNAPGTPLGYPIGVITDFSWSRGSRPSVSWPSTRPPLTSSKSAWHRPCRHPYPVGEASALLRPFGMAGIAPECLAGAAAQHAARSARPPSQLGQRNPFGQRVRSGTAAHCAAVPKCWQCSNNDIPCWNWIRFVAMSGSVGWWTCEQSAPTGGSPRDPGGRIVRIGSALARLPSRTHVREMRRAHPATAFLIFLCLLAFQAQTWARAALSCEHEAALGQDCPMHGSSLPHGDPRAMPGDGDDSFFDCAKCALAYALGALQVAPSSDPTRPVPSVSVPEVGSDVHFYRFFPEGHIRPPRPHLA